MNMSRAWIAVASADHVRTGCAGGFMQVCHGKAAPLKRVLPGDRVIYYSPKRTFAGNDRLQAFTAIGVVREGKAPYQADMGNGFLPWRRDVGWLPVEETPIQPLLRRLSFANNSANWGYKLRFGLFAISDEDADIIAQAMLTSVVSSR
jgi:hypothetical protein